MEGDVLPGVQVDDEAGVGTSHRPSMSPVVRSTSSRLFPSSLEPGMALSSLRSLEVLSYLLALDGTMPDTVMILPGNSPPGMKEC